ncbi:hypothetical protein [Novosphingobium sp.]|uniref:hypothetical protein n=1 Tax=Novosphingobium sp. TaxID=1874826 RepID=UPI002FE04F9E
MNKLHTTPLGKATQSSMAHEPVRHRRPANSKYDTPSRIAWAHRKRFGLMRSGTTPVSSLASESLKFIEFDKLGPAHAQDGDAVQVAAALAGPAESAWRHALAFAAGELSLDDAYQQFRTDLVIANASEATVDEPETRSVG